MLCMEQEYSFLWTLKRKNPGFCFVLADEKMSFCSEGGLVLQIKFVSSFRHSFFFFSSSSSSSSSPTPFNKQVKFSCYMQYTCSRKEAALKEDVGSEAIAAYCKCAKLCIWVCVRNPLTGHSLRQREKERKYGFYPITWSICILFVGFMINLSKQVYKSHS